MSVEIIIDKDQLEYYMAEGMEWDVIARLMGCSEPTIRRKAINMGLYRHRRKRRPNKKTCENNCVQYGSQIIPDYLAEGARVTVRTDHGQRNAMVLAVYARYALCLLDAGISGYQQRECFLFQDVGRAM